ncbi:MAG: hypothetical protein MI975_28500 [Cytophagales bacterium]|nr:hypothetical protein [Cytophagales bacterium]
MNTNRRNFLKAGVIASSGMTMEVNAINRLLEKTGNQFIENELLELSFELLQTWCKGLLHLQIDNNLSGIHGGIICPACSRIHGRIGDAIYPMMFLADKTNDETYLEAAIAIYNWMEHKVSFPDGSWVNDVNVSLWKGTTVFGTIALAEALIHHGHLLDRSNYRSWQNRLQRAANYVYHNFNMQFGNINYPITASYCLTLLGTALNNSNYLEKGRLLARKSLKYFTKKEKFLFGEGRPASKISNKNCRHIDLCYNVEESLPALVLYAKLANDNKVLEIVKKSLQTHAEFLLPDGAWDNSWGTRVFKWSYWGSRTSDGCQPAYALLAKDHPEFYKVALVNTRLLKKCTSNNLLYGGPHYEQHKLSACIHHTLSHSKALTTVLANNKKIKEISLPEKIVLPREIEYGVKKFSDIQTWLVSIGNWRGTITGYDINYGEKTGGHATGGALTILWNKEVGPIITASMNRYQLWEPTNMQMAKDEVFMPLTPRLELIENEVSYMNICDSSAEVEYTIKDEDIIIFTTKSELVDINQNFMSKGPVYCEIKYLFSTGKITIRGSFETKEYNDGVKFILPIISSGNEGYKIISDRKIRIAKKHKEIVLEANSPIDIIKTKKGRIFNFVPGMQAIPLKINSNNFEINISVV